MSAASHHADAAVQSARSYGNAERAGADLSTAIDANVSNALSHILDEAVPESGNKAKRVPCDIVMDDSSYEPTG